MEIDGVGKQPYAIVEQAQKAPIVSHMEYAIAKGPIEITSEKQFDELKNSGMPVVVDFYASWCGPCRSIAPVYEQLAKTYQGQITFLKVNVDQMTSLTKQYDVRGMPTFIFFNEEGEKVDRMSGANPEVLKSSTARLIGG